MARSNTSPLRRDPIDKPITDFNTIETTDLKKHYLISAAGLYANHQYADLALILKRKQPGF